MFWRMKKWQRSTKRRGRARIGATELRKPTWPVPTTHSGTTGASPTAAPSLIVDPADGRLPSLTPEGRRRQAAAAAHVREHEHDSAAERPLQERCITYHGVPPLPSG